MFQSDYDIIYPIVTVFQSRVVQGALEKLESMLQWTGVTPDEGPHLKHLKLEVECAVNDWPLADQLNF